MTNQHALRSRMDTLDIALIPAVARLPVIVPAERRNLAGRERLLIRIGAEFMEMPGLSLTLGQATRLFGLSGESSSRILMELIGRELLQLTADHHYVLRGGATKADASAE